MLASGRRGVLAVAALLALAAAGCRTVPLADPARVAALTPRLGELLLVGFPGTHGPDNPALERLLCEVRVGGVILFGGNVAEADQVAALTGWAQGRARACAGRPLLVAVDAEGGRVMRLGPARGFSPTLSARDLGAAGDLTVTELEARRVGRMLRQAGINWNLAPVVDLGYNPANPVIVGSGRAFGANPRLVAAHARAWVRGLRSAGVLTTLKHFPGHGSSRDDSHEGFVDVTDTANLEAELAPYRILLAEGMVDSVMTAHVVNRRIDPRYPATLSYATITGLLRAGIGFDGVVVTDDLRMAAIAEHWGIGEAAVRALEAGVDLLLVSSDGLPDGGSAAARILGALGEALAEGRLDPGRVERALERLEALRARLP